MSQEPRWPQDEKMRIIVVTLLYSPDGGPSAPLFGMLCENLALRGHKVTVIAAVPHYPSGRVPPEFQGRWIQRSCERGVEVIRIRVPSLDRTDLKQRMLQFISYQIGAAWAGVKQGCDVVLITNPALETWLPFLFLSRLRHLPAVFSVQDIYPAVGVTLGIFRHQTVISIVEWLERFCLNQSKFIQIISESFIKPLHSLGISESKMMLVPNWVDTSLIRPLPRDNAFSREQGLCHGFVVLYAGNIGLSQGLEHVLTTAEMLRDRKDILFVLLGGGAGCDHLKSQAQELRLENVRFLPFQARSRLPEVLATADISLVTLRKGIGISSLPSKCYSIMASGRPLIVSVDEESDIWKLVKRSGAGICVPPENPEALAKTIVELKDDSPRREFFGHKGREFALKFHSPEAAAEKFEHLLLSALATH
jgi:colanic acid biosynthesis glycosyl transferase WcaI